MEDIGLKFSKFGKYFNFNKTSKTGFSYKMCAGTQTYCSEDKITVFILSKAYNNLKVFHC